MNILEDARNNEVAGLASFISYKPPSKPPWTVVPYPAQAAQGRPSVHSVNQ